LSGCSTCATAPRDMPLICATQAPGSLESAPRSGRNLMLWSMMAASRRFFCKLPAVRLSATRRPRAEINGCRNTTQRWHRITPSGSPISLRTEIVKRQDRSQRLRFGCEARSDDRSGRAGARLRQVRGGSMRAAITACNVGGGHAASSTGVPLAQVTTAARPHIRRSSRGNDLLGEERGCRGAPCIV